MASLYGFMAHSAVVFIRKSEKKFDTIAQKDPI